MCLTALRIACHLAVVRPDQVQLLEQIARAKELARGPREEVFDAYRNEWTFKRKPDLAIMARLIELEARVRGLLNTDQDSADENANVEVSVDELREILKGIEKNGEPATAAKRTTDARANPRR